MATLLIVEDSEPIRFGLTEYFEGRGYQVAGVSSLDEAKAGLRAKAYDLVITDLRLSDHVEGLDVISEVRERYPNTRVILLTAYGSPAVEAAANHLGVDLFLHKPIRLAELEQAAASLLVTAA